MRRIVLTLSAAGLVLLSAGPVLAHAAYERSDPADRSTVSAPPSSVWAEFSEPLSGGSYLAVFDPCGEQVDHGDSFISGYRVTISMSAEAAGTYTVRFRVISTLDGHPTEGSFTFTASSGAPCGGQEPEPAPEEPAPEQPAPTDRQPRRAERSGAPDQAATATGEPSAASAGPDRARERGGATERKDRDRRARPALALQGSDEVTPAPRTTARPSVWDGIRPGPFAVALVLAALIGAAGGKVYAGIMGPRA